ncbi:MAG: isochorismatase [Anaerolineales bacterium]
MTYPSFYDPERVGTLYVPDTADAIGEGLAAGLTQAAADDRRIVLLLIDAQVDFIHLDGALCVPGAVEDARRTAEWIYRHVSEITAIAASLDSHLPAQIFYPTWWVNEAGEHPDPYTPITSQQVKQGVWKPVYQPEWSARYVKRLQEQAKKELMIWPYHTMIGTPGHSLTPALYEALVYHAAARQADPRFIIKGNLPQTEFYSLLEPEVKVPDDPRGQLNRDFLDELLGYDLIYLGGQAKSHCVLETVTSFMRTLGDDAEAIGKLRLLEDCTSSVQHPEIDFESIANQAYAGFRERGLRLVQSTDPID